MSVVLTFMASRQSAASPTIVLWGGVDPGTTRLVVLVSRRRLTPDEADAALSGTLPECERFQVPPTVDALRDDVSPAGPARYYAVLAEQSDGSRKPLRFRAGPMSQPPEQTIDASTLLPSPAPVMQAAPAPVVQAAPAPVMQAAPAPVVQAVSAPVAASPAPETTSVDPLEARRAAQRRAQQAVLDASPVEVSARADEAVRPPSDFPSGRFGLRMIGATQSWDGLRVQWESEGREANAFEVVIADHPLAPDEVGELLSGEAVPGAAVRAVGRSVRAVIDNHTPREARGYYAVIARTESGDRVPVGCVAQGWDECRVAQAPFFNPQALDEIRDLANGQVREARVQLMLWEEDQDAGAWREALRLAEEALIVYPHFGPALECRRDVDASRRR